MTGANVTYDKVMDFLRVREAQKTSARRKQQEKQDSELMDVNEGAAALRHYEGLADRRIDKRKRLRESRKLRFHLGRTRART